MIIKLNKINVLKTGCFFAILYSFLSIFIALIGVLQGKFQWWFLIILPLLYLIGGFIGGIVSAFFYNLVAKIIGGLEFNAEKIQKFSE